MTEENPKPECIFCGIVEGKIGSAKIYEDEFVLAVLDIMPASNGQAIVIPKKHVFVSGQLDEKLGGHLFNVANKLASILFEVTGATGTNLLISNGPSAGQKMNHTVLQIIPRFENDGINISWNGKQADEKELRELHAKILTKMGVGEAKETKTLEENVSSFSETPIVEEPSEIEEEHFDDEEKLP
jgi:histidine triad (HIT) family protein